MSERGINAYIDVLKSHVDIVGADLSPRDHAITHDLAVAGIELLRQFMLDVSRCAEALEALAQDRITARSGEKWP